MVVDQIDIGGGHAFRIVVFMELPQPFMAEL
jgi:hypothetical protein